MEHLVHPYILEIDSYMPGLSIEEIQRKFSLTKVIKLASNENCFPLPEHVRQAIGEEAKLLRLYPDSDNHYLRQKIAQYYGVDRDEVLTGAGSVELIRIIITTFLKPGEHVLTSEKTFSFYRIAVTERAGQAAYIEAPMDGNLCFDLEQIRLRIKKETKIIFLTNPNNPTGTIISGRKIRDFVLSLPEDILVVLDNAYQEYVDDLADYETGISLISQKRNIIILHTFSKIYGLAGLRIGFAIAKRETIAWMNRVKPPFNINRISQRAAIASLQNDDYKNKSAAHNRSQREKLFQELKSDGFRVLPSQANFILFFPGVDVPTLNLMLMQKGVIVRPTDSFGIPEAIRVTVGLEEENNMFLAKLREAMASLRKKKN